MMTPMMGTMVRNLRKHLNLTQKELAVRVGVQQNTISQYESGRIDPSLAVLKHLLELSAGSPVEGNFRFAVNLHESWNDDRELIAAGLPSKSNVKVQTWLQGVFDRGFQSGLARGLASSGSEIGDEREAKFLDLMRRFLKVADRDTIAIVENLAATRVKQHEREAGVRNKDRKESA